MGAMLIVLSLLLASISSAEAHEDGHQFKQGTPFAMVKGAGDSFGATELVKHEVAEGGIPSEAASALEGEMPMTPWNDDTVFVIVRGRDEDGNGVWRITRYEPGERLGSFAVDPLTPPAPRLPPFCSDGQFLRWKWGAFHCEYLPTGGVGTGG